MAAIRLAFCAVTRVCPPGAPDTDGDGICNILDNCVSVRNTNQSDVDRDGKWLPTVTG
jgi:hypothetical protein